MDEINIIVIVIIIITIVIMYRKIKTSKLPDPPALSDPQTIQTIQTIPTIPTIPTLSDPPITSDLKVAKYNTDKALEAAKENTIDAIFMVGKYIQSLSPDAQRDGPGALVHVNVFLQMIAIIEYNRRTITNGKPPKALMLESPPDTIPGFKESPIEILEAVALAFKSIKIAADAVTKESFEFKK